jgi:hypothetical protein
MRVTHLISLKWLAVALVVARTLSAQAPGSAPIAREGTLIPIPYRTFVAFDPSIIVFDFGSFELESGVAPGLTIGGVGSYTTINRDRYASGDLNIRYYPGEVVLRGLSFGISAGVLRFTGRDSLGTRQQITVPTIGVLGHYNWLIGPSHRFLVGSGVGAKRVIASETERRKVDLGRAYLTGRFVVGYAF